MQVHFLKEESRSPLPLSNAESSCDYRHSILSPLLPRLSPSTINKINKKIFDIEDRSKLYIFHFLLAACCLVIFRNDAW